MDLTETMKQVLAKVSGGAQGLVNPVNNSATSHAALMQQHHQLQQQQQHSADSSQGAGYVTEKLYMLLQLYLQNKGWNPSIELLQCFSELKDSALLPSAAYLQVLANRLSLDAQGRLVLRESGKIVLPYEHFANAIMLKHMTGPHGLHLSVDATVRSVVESYTIGRENFGMEKEFIIEVVQSCPNPACRYYKTHLGSGVGFMDAAFQSAVSAQSSVDFLQHLSQPPLMQQPNVPPLPPPPSQSSLNSSANSIIDMNQLDSSAVKQYQQTAQSISHLSSSSLSQKQSQHQQHSNVSPQLQQQRAAIAAAEKHLKMTAPNQQHQITAAIIQQQNRAIAQQNLEKFSNMSTIEKQRVLQQLDKKQYDTTALLHTDSRTHDRNIQPTHLPPRSPQIMGASSPLDLQQQQHQQPLQSKQSHQQKIADCSMKSSSNLEVSLIDSPTNKDLLALHNGAWGAYQQQQQSQQLQNLSARDVQPTQTMSNISNLSIHQSQQQQQQQPQQQQQQNSSQSQMQQPVHQPQQQYQPQSQQASTIGQENIVRVFDELMKNIARMKMFVRPSMCKPYGKQSESLQKTLMDTIQIVQSLRNCIPAPAIQINSWKNEDRNA